MGFVKSWVKKANQPVNWLITGYFSYETSSLWTASRTTEKWRKSALFRLASTALGPEIDDFGIAVGSQMHLRQLADLAP